ncbi:MAG: hypothetical protein ACE5FT_04300 [Candidatus Nanoarchaeia archaeon]
MDDCTYNHIKLLHQLSLVDAFLVRHCHEDAESKKHKGCCKALGALQKDVRKHMKTLQKGLTKHKF